MAFNPIRNFAKYFTNLTPGQMREFERAMNDFQNSAEITNLVASLQFLRRKPNQSLAVPEVSATPIVRGAILEWNLLPDQRIAVYEIQVSTDPNFASFTTSSTFGNNAIIEGLSTTTFVRVRGVRTDGTQGPFSNTITINPFIFSIKGRTEEAFYVQLTDDTAFTVLGGAGSDFEYQPVNPEGVSMFWGLVSMYANPEIDPQGSEKLQMKLVSKVVETGTDTEIWRNSASGFFGTYHIGPVTVQHPETQQTLQVRLDVQDQTPQGKFYPSEVLYASLSSLELGSNTS